MPQFGVVHFDTRLFADPHRFDPEHFLDAHGQPTKIDEFNPFGIGKRACLGENLAAMELFLIFTTLMQHFRFDVCDRSAEPPSLTPIVGMTSVPRPYRCRVSLVV